MPEELMVVVVSVIAPPIPMLACAPVLLDELVLMRPPFKCRELLLFMLLKSLDELLTVELDDMDELDEAEFVPRPTSVMLAVSLPV